MVGRKPEEGGRATGRGQPKAYRRGMWNGRTAGQGRGALPMFLLALQLAHTTSHTTPVRCRQAMCAMGWTAARQLLTPARGGGGAGLPRLGCLALGLGGRTMQPCRGRADLHP